MYRTFSNRELSRSEHINSNRKVKIKQYQSDSLVIMSTKVEQTTNDLLHFSGKFKVGKLNPHDGAKKKKKMLLRASSRAALWNVKCSQFALKTHNPIRAIVDGLKIEPNKDKPMIALSIGNYWIFFKKLQFFW